MGMLVVFSLSVFAIQAQSRSAPPATIEEVSMPRVPLLLLLFSVSLTARQSATPTFEVASIKPMEANSIVRNPVDIQPGGRLIFRNTVKGLIGTAYQRRPFDSREVIGGPDWLDSQRFEVITKAEGQLVDSTGFPAPVFAMIRSLLAERFRLVVREEQRDRAVYVLEQIKAGAPLGRAVQPTQVDCAEFSRQEANGRPPAFDPTKPRPCSIGPLPGQLRASGVTMASFASVLSGYVERPVVDHTGLQGSYDLQLEFSADFRPGVPVDPGAPRGPADGPSLFTALQEQAGLKLTTGRAPVDVLVVEHVERPTTD